MSTDKLEKSLFMRFLTSRTLLHAIIAIATFAIISWLYFYPDAMQGNILKQHDVQQGIAIGQEAKAFTAATGETTRWTNSLFSGMPNFQISPSYESSKLITWISKAYSLGFPSPVNLAFIMMLGFYILLMAFDVKWYIAIPGAVAWAFSTYFFILIGAGHIWKYVTLAYIPPTIAGLVWAYRGKLLTGGIVAALFATLQIASNHVQMTYYFLFVILALVIAYLIIAIKNKSVATWGKATGVLACAAIIAVAANSPNLYNTYLFSKETIRGGHSELTQPNSSSNSNATANGLDKDYITQWSYGIDETLTLLVPNVKGGASLKPEKGNNMPLLLSDTKEAHDLQQAGKIDPEAAQNLQAFYQYFGDQPMTNGPVYIGALIFVLFIIGCFVVKGPVKWCLLVVTLLSIALSWGHNMMWLSDIFIDYFPMYNKFRTVSSILVIAEFTMPLLAVLGLQKMVTTPDFFKKNQTLIFTIFGVCAFICLVLIFMPTVLVGSPYSQQEGEYYISQGLIQQYPTLFAAVEQIRYEMIASDAWRSLWIIVAGFATLFLFWKNYIKTEYCCLIITAIIVVDLFTVNKRYLSHDSFTQPAYESAAYFEPRHVDKMILQDTTQNYRVLDINHFTEAMPSYFHKTIGGYNAAKLSRYQDIIDHNIQISNEGVNINPAVLDMLNSKYVIVSDSLAQFNPGALGNAWFVDTLKFVDTPNAEMAAIQKFNPATTAYSDKKFTKTLGGTISPKAAGDTIFEVTYAPNKLVYHSNSQKGGLAVFSEVYFPWGWDATIDGNKAEIGRVNYILRALKVPAGSHTIQFSFDPQSIKVTETIAYVAIILLYIGIIAMIVTWGVKYKKEAAIKQ